jgi:hypothetical protein
MRVWMARLQKAIDTNGEYVWCSNWWRGFRSSCGSRLWRVCILSEYLIFQK